MKLALRLFLPFAAGYFLSYLLRNVNAIIAPELTRELGLSAANLGLLTSAYLLAFSAVQLPLGILLDRYGPRRVEASLLLVAALGAGGFALGSNLGELALARAAIGVGVSACLMAAFKAFSMWYPTERLPALNSAVMVAGGLGALAATTPVAWLEAAIGWRMIFFGLAALFTLAAAGIWTTPERSSASAGATLGQQWRELLGVYGSATFWRYAPMTMMIVGGFVALQGLWAAPWLMQVEGLARGDTAQRLFVLTVAMVGGLLATALFIDRLRRAGIASSTVMIVGNLVGLAAMGAIAAGVGPPLLAWVVLGAMFAAANIAYAQLTSLFAPHLAGRVNTALNLVGFVAAFAIQWSYGVALDTLKEAGWTPAQAHRAAFSALLALQALGTLWYFIAGRRGEPGLGGTVAGATPR